MRVAPRVVLSPEERAALERWSRRAGSSDFLAVRARTLLRAANGQQDTEIAQALGISRVTVARWRSRFLSGRLRGVEQRSSVRLAAGRIPDERIRSIVRAGLALDGGHPHRSSTRGVAAQFGVSHSTVRRTWLAHGIRPERLQARPARPDPARGMTAADLLGVYLHPPDYVVAFSLAPSPATTPQARSEQPGVPTFPAGLRPLVSPWPSLEPSPAVDRATDLLRFVTELSRLPLPAAGARVVVAGPGLDRTPALTRWRFRHPNFRFDFPPDGTAWREALRRGLGELAHGGDRLRTFGARGESSRSLRLFFAGYTPSSAPFRWVASPEEVTGRGGGFRLRYDLSVTGHTGFKKPAPVSTSMAIPTTVDPRLRRMARLVLRESLRVQKQERVTIETWSGTVDAANAFVLETLRLGAQPMLLYQDESTYWAAASEVSPAHLARLGSHERAALERSDALVSFFGPSDRERFHALPRPTAFKLGEYSDAVYRAAAKGRARAVQIALGRLSAPSARMYGVDQDAWREELIESTLLSPAALHRRAARLSARLRKGRTLRICHPNGTDVTLGLRHRPPAVSDGIVPRAETGGDWNMIQLPAGVVTVAVDERVAEGTFRSNVSNSVGVMDTIGEVSGGNWEFHDGRLSRFSYVEGQELFAESYGRAALGRDRPGTISIGLNERIERAPLLQDQAYGAVTLQLGRNAHVGGATRSAWWAWLILRGADVLVDDLPLVRRGRLV